MATLPIDLSGGGGLVYHFAGDLNDTSASPSKRYLGSDAELADGIFNPLRTAGYLSPANNKYADLTGTITNRFVSRTYASSTDTAFFAQNGPVLSTVAGLDGTSVSNTTLLPDTSVFKDIELYEINGYPAILYSYYRQGSTSQNSAMRLGFRSLDTTKGAFLVSARVHERGVDTANETITSASNEKLAQKFSTSDFATTGELSPTGVRLRLLTNGGTSQTWTLRVSIQTDNAGRPSGTPVTNGTINVDPNTLSPDYTFEFYEFSTAPSLSASTTYHLVIEPTSFGDLSGNEGVTWLRSDSTGGLYANGQAQQYIAAAWANADASTNEAFDFAIVLNESSVLTTQTGVAGFHAGYDLEDITDGFLKKADNSYLYWITGNRVHKFDGTFNAGDVGIVTQSVLEFPSYLTCVDAVDTNSLLYIGIQSSEISSGSDYRTFGADTMGVYVWDRQTTQINTRNFMPIYGAREIRKLFINADGELRVMTIGEDRFTEIRGIVNGRLQVIKRLGLSSYPVYRDGLDHMNNMVVWLGADGIIYAYGKVTPGDKEAIFKIGNINAEVSGTLTSGVLLTGHESSGASLQGVLISWADNSNTLTKWYPHGTGTISSVAQTGNQGDVYTKVSYLPTLANLKSIDIVCLPNGTAGNSTTVATIKFYANQSTTAFMSKTVTRDDISKGYISYEINKPYVTAFQMEIEWSTSQTLGGNDFQPAYAIMEYEATRTRGGKTAGG